MGASIRWSMWGAVMVALVASVMSQTPASSSGCVTALLGCQEPLKNSTETPGPKCCVPLKNAVKTQKECVCGIIDNPSLLSTYNITTDQIFNLAARCNVTDATPSLCASAPTPSPPATPPPPPPGKNSGSTYDVITWSGIALILAVMAASVF